MTESLAQPDPMHSGGNRCRARSRRTGELCKNPPMLGSTVCRMHGGAAPQVKRKAQQRLDEAADRMAKRLLGFAENEKVPPYVALQAILAALDRAGINPKTKVDLEVTSKPFEELLGRISGISNMTREESRRRRGLADAPAALGSGRTDAGSDDVVDAEVLEEPVGGWRDEAHDITESGPASPAGVRTPSAGVTGPGDGPPSATGPAGAGLAALADMTERELDVLARQEGQANLRERQATKDNAAWEADNKSRKAAGEPRDEHRSPVTHTREQAAADMRLQRGILRRGPGNQARYDAEQETALGLPPQRWLD